MRSKVEDRPLSIYRHRLRHETGRHSLDVEERKVGTGHSPPVWRLPEMRKRGRPIGAVEALAFPVSPSVLTGLPPLRQDGVGLALLV